MKVRRPSHLRIVAVTVTVVAAGTTAIGAAGSSVGDATRAQALAEDAPITFAPAIVTWQGSELSQRADSLAQRVPLPTGGNFNGIRWSDLETASDDDINFILQFNAACQWLRATADGRDAANASAIWNLIPTWPAMQRNGNGGAFLEALGQLRTPAAGQEPAALIVCRESHQRERLYAAAHDRAPPR